MILAALIFAATLRYESILTKHGKPVFESGASQYEFYAEGDAGGGRKIVVYGFTPVKRAPYQDFDHRIFVALLERKGDAYELVSKRRDVTDSTIDTGVPGEFADLLARVNVFTLRKQPYADVQLWTSISGTGGISASDDVIFRIEKAGTLNIAAKLRGTETYSRNGWPSKQQTRSDLAVGEDALVWTRSERFASRDDADKPFRVKCDTTRRTYRPKGRSLARSSVPAKGKLTPLSRVDLREIVPCCNKCNLSD